MLALAMLLHNIANPDAVNQELCPARSGSRTCINRTPNGRLFVTEPGKPKDDSGTLTKHSGLEPLLVVFDVCVDETGLWH